MVTRGFSGAQQLTGISLRFGTLCRELCPRIYLANITDAALPISPWANYTYPAAPNPQPSLITSSITGSSRILLGKTGLTQQQAPKSTGGSILIERIGRLLSQISLQREVHGAADTPLLEAMLANVTAYPQGFRSRSLNPSPIDVGLVKPKRHTTDGRRGLAFHASGRGHLRLGTLAR